MMLWDSDGIMGELPWLMVTLWESDGIMEELPWLITSQDSEGVSFDQLDLSGF